MGRSLNPGSRVKHGHDGNQAPEQSANDDGLLLVRTGEELEVRAVPEELSASDASLRKVARALLALAYQVLEEESE